jgi:1,2-beta-oligoglucan phosphorylase
MSLQPKSPNGMNPVSAAAPVVFPIRLSSPSGLSVECNANGSIRRMDHGDIMLNLIPGNEMDGGLANIHLRRLGATVETVPLLGPGSPACYQHDERGWFASGIWGDIRFRLRLVPAESAPAWFWHVSLENTGTAPVTCDLIHTQDMALAHYGMIRINEFYVSQYVDHTPLSHPVHGCAIASRQNLPMGGRCPWTVIGSLRRGVSHATDAFQFHGLTTRAGGTPPGLASGLPGSRLQHEHSMAAIQDEPLVLEPGGTVASGFFGWFEPDKPEATTASDISKIDTALALPEAVPPAWPEDAPGPAPAESLFTRAPKLASLPLDDAAIARFFGSSPRHAEIDDGQLRSFFTGDRSHVVLQAKELMVLRPHGHLLRSGGSLTPDESALTSTAWMNGVFHSMVTQGHVSINRFLSTCHTYLGLFRSHGQRVFVETGGAWQLLDVPSAFEMRPDSCRWIYRHRDSLIEVVSTAPDHKHELRLSLTVREGPPVRFLISHHVALNGDDGSASVPAVWERQGNSLFVQAIAESDVGRRFPGGGFRLTPADGTTLETVGGDDLLFSDGITRRQPFLCCITAPSIAAGLTIEGRLVACEAEVVAVGAGFWDSIGGGLKINAPGTSPLAAAAGRAAEIFPWFIHNALVHYLSPRGLEQYSGGGWGTRDVCQGPVELLLALGRFEPIRDLLRRVFRQQNPDGDWPQWFMFFDRERGIRPGDSHGDIVYWPVLALAQYLAAAGDAALLDEVLPFFDHAGEDAAEKATVWQHVERALDLMGRRVIAGTRLAAYGHGDWNDSLQPARPDMRERLCSSWTVTLNYQTLTALADALGRLGDTGRAATLKARAASILEEFQRVLMVDGVIAGLAYFHENGRTDYLLHPRDGATGLSFRVLPMIHAIINEMLTPSQAETHLALIREHLLGPDGVHLFDRPMAYHGGPQTYFQRAESASFFGREIGIMYTHAHLRYCEALARFGDAAGFFHALSQINPIGIRDLVPSATPRQANCYYSSSDAAFPDRYAAFDDYGKVKTGGVPLEGGWRVYSSGAGISVRLILQCLLGMRLEKSSLVLDPVIPPSLDGLQAVLNLAGRRVAVTYRIGSKGRGPVSVHLNGCQLDFVREPNAYRPGAARLAMDDLASRLTGNGDHLIVWLE